MSKRKLKYTNVNYMNAGRNNQRKQILLSISILVSGRTETTEKCIASLEHLRRRVSCELILTDTGCPAEMREWLKQKADRVLRFTWCDDFAAARNVGLRAARGQWFMFMDDDEWFEDTTQIEAFFLSGEYRRYQSASYVVRNYVNMEGTGWRDIHLTRMTLRRPDTRFFYPIHESLWPLLEPEKYLEDYAHHYGYASADPEVQMAKRKRNLGILLSAIEEDPHCMKHYLQAVAEYYAMDDFEAAWKIADTGIANCDPSREENALHIDGLYAAAVRMRLRGKRSQEVVLIGKEYLGNAPVSDLAKASICGDLSIAYGELGENKLCLKYLQDYLNWKEYFEGHREIWLKQEIVILDSCFEHFQYRKLMGWGFAAALSLKKAQDAENLLMKESLEWWMDAVRGWYTLSSPQGREKWQEDFRAVIESLELESQGDRTGNVLRLDCWNEEKEPYSCLRQLYRILTVPEPGHQIPAGHDMKTEMPEPSGQKAVSQEIEALAVQLKEKVRFLIRQGEMQAALGVIGQLQAFFPEDAELAELRVQCESE